jgi:cytochrome P450
MLTQAFSTVPAHSSLKAIPGDSGWPVIGHTLSFMYDPIAMLGERYSRFGSVSWSSLFGLRMVQLIGPEANELVLLNKDKVFSNHDGWDYFIGRFFHRGIMLLDFEEHRWHRKIMQQAFKPELLKNYLTHMGTGIKRGLESWQPDTSFKVLPAIKQLTLNLATETFMGYHLGPEANQINRAFVDTVRAGTALIRFSVPGLRWSRGLAGRRVLETFFAKEIGNKRRSPGADFFSQLCQARTEEGDEFSDDDVINHMIFLMMAAHDTTTITLCSMLYWLARYPEWQERLRQQSRQLGKMLVEYEDLDKLTEASLVMKEALRLCSPVPSLPRKTLHDSEFMGYYLPANTMVNVIPFYTHYMEDYWPDPLRFDPERFSTERREDKVHPYAWVPFGGGAHKCIGLHFAELQVKAILHQLLQRFLLSVPPDYEMPLDTTSLPIPADKLPVCLKRI